MSIWMPCLFATERIRAVYTPRVVRANPNETAADTTSTEDLPERRLAHRQQVQASCLKQYGTHVWSVARVPLVVEGVGAVDEVPSLFCSCGKHDESPS